MKILMCALNAKFVHTNLALPYLKEMVRDIQDTKINEYTINMELSHILADIHRGKYDLVLFSCYIWNIERILKISNDLKKVNKDIKIVLGGPEVSFETRELMEANPYIDYVIAGEGEIAFRDLIEHLQGKKDIDSCKNIFYRKDESIIETKEQGYLLQNLNEIPSPFMNLKEEDIKNRIVYYESSRGCPFNCYYCLSSTLKGLRFFDIDRVKQDIKKIIELEAKQVKFVDRTFNAKKDYAIDLLSYIKEIDNGKINFHFEVTAHLMDEDMMDLFKDCREGLFQFEVGVQSTNPKTLEAVGRFKDFDKLSEVVNRVAKGNNIHQHLDLIVGLPYEDYNSFKKSFNDVFKLKPEMLQIGFLKMLKGSRMKFEAEQYNYVYRNYPPYEVLANDYMSYDEILILKEFEEIVETYWNSGNFEKAMNHMIKDSYEGFEFTLFEEIRNFYDENGYFEVSQGRDANYMILLKFWESKQKDLKQLRNLLKSDYLRLGRVSSLPQFLRGQEDWFKKEMVHELLRNEEFMSKNLPKYKGELPKNLLKHIHMEAFEIKDESGIDKKIVGVFDYKKSKDFLGKAWCIELDFEELKKLCVL